MPFIKIKGLPGKLYVPEDEPETPKKNTCPDCFSCQMCSDSRCQICLNKNSINIIAPCECKRQTNEKKHI